jgi:hypothetical protein
MLLLLLLVVVPPLLKGDYTCPLVEPIKYSQKFYNTDAFWTLVGKQIFPRLFFLSFFGWGETESTWYVGH